MRGLFASLWYNQEASLGLWCSHYPGVSGQVGRNSSPTWVPPVPLAMHVLHFLGVSLSHTVSTLLTLGLMFLLYRDHHKVLLWVEKASRLRIKSWVVVLALPITNNVISPLHASVSPFVKKKGWGSGFLRPSWKFETHRIWIIRFSSDDIYLLV